MPQAMLTSLLLGYAVKGGDRLVVRNMAQGDTSGKKESDMALACR